MLENIFVTIYSPSKNAMQSGMNNSNIWKIKFPTDQSKYRYKLMSWTGSADTKQQLNLTFDSKEQAIKFAERNNWKYNITEPKHKVIKAKSYADNFTK